MADTNQDQRQNGPKGSLLVSALLVFLLKIVGGVSSLFHLKGTYSNMKGQEREFFSSMLDGMKQGPDEKDR